MNEARDFVAAWHRRLPFVQGARWAVAIYDTEQARTVCVALGASPARMIQDGQTINISRVASDGTAPHAASMALGAARRAALVLGYRRVLTYTQMGEAGISCKAAGFWPTAVTDGGEHDRESRPRQMALDPGKKIRWESGPDAWPLDPKAAALVPGWHGRRALVAEPRSVA